MPAARTVRQSRPKLSRQGPGASRDAHLVIPITDAPAPKPKRHTSKREENHIPRPRNSFIIFRSEVCARLTNSVEHHHKNISRIAGNLWREISEPERNTYKKLADDEKAHYKQMYPTYKYKPNTTHKSPKSRAKGPPEELERCEGIAALLRQGKEGQELLSAVEKMDRDSGASQPKISRPARAAKSRVRSDHKAKPARAVPAEEEEHSSPESFYSEAPMTPLDGSVPDLVLTSPQADSASSGSCSSWPSTARPSTCLSPQQHFDDAWVNQTMPTLTHDLPGPDDGAFLSGDGYSAYQPPEPLERYYSPESMKDPSRWLQDPSQWPHHPSQSLHDPSANTSGDHVDASESLERYLSGLMIDSSQWLFNPSANTSGHSEDAAVSHMEKTYINFGP